MERVGRFVMAQQRRRPVGAALQQAFSARRQYHRVLLLRHAAPRQVGAALGAGAQGRLVLLFPGGGRRQMGSKGGKGEEAAAGAEQEQEAGSKEGQEQEAGKEEAGGKEGQEDPDPEPDPEPQERIGVLRGLLYLTVFGLAMGSLYFIADELMPTRMSANHLFNEAFDAVKQNHEVLNRYGEPLRGYGRDGGGRREGRRNFVEHKNYVAEDGSKRLRIRFNIEGPFGHAFVFAEVTGDMPKGQWMYLLVQDLQTGRVLTIEDNRAMHDALGKARSDEEREAIKALIQSGGGK